jgi:hypothetical protein
MVGLNVNVLNQDNELTFVITNRKEIIDLTVGINEAGNLVSEWNVSHYCSLSDHRYNCFQMNIKLLLTTPA